MIKGMLVTQVKLLLSCLRHLALVIFRVKLTGLSQIELTGKTVLMPNHVSLLDAVYLALILPKHAAFVVNTDIAKRFAWALLFREHIAVDPTNPYAVRKMLKTIQSGTPLVIFPEGRITTTGSMMKIYDGIGYLALRSQARIVPIALNGLEYSKTFIPERESEAALVPLGTHCLWGSLSSTGRGQTAFEESSKGASDTSHPR